MYFSTAVPTHQAIQVCEKEVVEASKIEVSFDDEDSDLENDLKREFKNEVEKLRIGMLQLIAELKNENGLILVDEVENVREI